MEAQSVEDRVEEFFVQLFKANRFLKSMYIARWTADTAVTLPSICVKASPGGLVATPGSGVIGQNQPILWNVPTDFEMTMQFPAPTASTRTLDFLFNTMTQQILAVQSQGLAGILIGSQTQATSDNWRRRVQNATITTI